MKFIVVLVVLAAALLVGGELLVKPAAEDGAAELVQKRYQLTQKPAVQLNGFPFLVRGLAGRLDSVIVSLDRYDAGGLLVRRFSLRLEPVTFSLSSVVRGQGEIHTDKGTAEAVVAQGDLSSYLASRDLPIEVRLSRGGVTVARTVAGTSFAATGQLSFSEGELRFTPERVVAGGANLPGPLSDLFAFAVPIPAIAGVQLTSLTLRDGEAAIGADVSGYVIAQLPRAAVRVAA